MQQNFLSDTTVAVHMKELFFITGPLVKCQVGLYWVTIN